MLHPVNSDSGGVTTAGAVYPALRKAAGLWFLITLVGLWVFLYRIVVQYVVATVAGDFEGWERNNQLFRGYVPGDTIGNLNFAVLVMLAAVIVYTCIGTAKFAMWVQRST